MQARTTPPFHYSSSTWESLPQQQHGAELSRSQNKGAGCLLFIRVLACVCACLCVRVLLLVVVPVGHRCNCFLLLSNAFGRVVECIHICAIMHMYTDGRLLLLVCCSSADTRRALTITCEFAVGKTKRTNFHPGKGFQLMTGSCGVVASSHRMCPGIRKGKTGGVCDAEQDERLKNHHRRHQW